jgi:hypothetical protein
MCLFQSFSKKIGLTMTVDVAQGIECCCILNDQMRTRWGSSSATSMTATSATGNSEINPSLFIKALQYFGKISYHQVNKELSQQTKQLLCLPPEYIVT